MMGKPEKSPAWRAWLRRGLLGILIVTAGWMLWRGQPAEKPPLASTPSPAPTREAASQRSLREAAYDKDRLSLEKLLESGAADADTQAAAARRLEQLVDSHQAEIAVEEALRKAGYAPALVLVQNGAMTVLLEPGSPADSAAILTLCAAHAGVSAENIRIMTAD